MNLITKTTEVFLAKGPVTSIGYQDIAFLRKALTGNAKGRVRINLHPDNDDPLHEMFIAIRQDSYIRPHKHPNKSESFHIVYGEVDVVIFKDDGDIHQVIKLAANSSSKAFYYRMSKPFFHTLVIKSELVVVHEITNGPFVKDGTIFATFSPTEEEDTRAISVWTEQLADRVGKFE